MVMTDEQVLNEEVYVLSPKDRCDSCHAEALVLVKGVSGDLMFCGHHYNKHEEKLKAYAFEIIDERNKLIQNKLIGFEN
jgi:hypothetical protein